MELDYKVVVEELIRLFESDAGDLPILHTAIRCLNQQAQEIDTLRAMLKTFEENAKKTEDELTKEASYYLGQYERVSEMLEQRIDANYNLRVLHSAMLDGMKILHDKLIAETDALDMKIYVDLIYKNLMENYSDGIGGIISFETMDR